MTTGPQDPLRRAGHIGRDIFEISSSICRQWRRAYFASIEICRIYELYRDCACFVYKSQLSLLKSAVQLETPAEFRGGCATLRDRNKRFRLYVGKIRFNLVKEQSRITIRLIYGKVLLQSNWE